MTPRPGLAAVILAGGTAVRLGGVDKASIEYAGATLLERAVAAAVAAEEVVVVGDPVPTSRPVTFTREQPPLGGPVAGLLAGRAALARTPRRLLVLAVDMPHVTSATVERLAAAASGEAASGDGAVLVGADDRIRLVLLLDPHRLDEAAPADPHGAALRSLLAGLDLATVAAVGDEAHGVDRWEDLRDLGG